jgi:hypothetical protein
MITKSAPPAKGRHVRLRILEAAGGPSIWDFELYDSGAAGRTK